MLLVVSGTGSSELTTYDGTRFVVSRAELRQAVDRFVELVDKVLRRRFDWSLDDIERALR